MSWMMRSRSLRQHLLSSPKSKSYGPFVMSGSPVLVEILSNIGYGHIVIDMEHSPIDLSNLVHLLRAIDSAAVSKTVSTKAAAAEASIPTVPMVRVPSCRDIAMTKRVLDVLRPPAGIIFPMVETAEDAEIAVASTKYPDQYTYKSSSSDHDQNHNRFHGLRGCAYPFVRASSYGTNINYYHQTSKHDLLVCCQIESERAIENIPQIASVPGVDCIFLGPFDISCSLGYVGQFDCDDGIVMEKIHWAESLVRDQIISKRYQKNNNSNNNSNNDNNSLILGGFRTPNRTLNEMFSPDIGYQLVCGTVDLKLVSTAAMIDYKEGSLAMGHHDND